MFSRNGPCLFIGDVCLNAYEQNTETDESFDVSHRMQNITWCTHDHFFLCWPRLCYSLSAFSVFSYRVKVLFYLQLDILHFAVRLS